MISIRSDIAYPGVVEEIQQLGTSAGLSEATHVGTSGILD